MNKSFMIIFFFGYIFSWNHKIDIVDYYYMYLLKKKNLILKIKIYN